MVQGELRGEYGTSREKQIREFILLGRNEHQMWLIVQFDDNIRWTIDAGFQTPLITAWAMTIHKSQGMTLNEIVVDVGKSFEEGQEYGALSRARSWDGLKVMSLGDNVGKGGNELVKQFLKLRLRLC
ncbi:hypothetical protein AC579_9916 [Pseudocercospora musae]|uniref:UvrD-like helicase C-terminal domain-containing protein n=1 Tax=Pseudocercospora musae TaxID=113226 RepID=A0A139IFC7_9PEZI|nr:hypothetical protein AC579_9916 [Pseudocercospora musae]